MAGLTLDAAAHPDASSKKGNLRRFGAGNGSARALLPIIWLKTRQIAANEDAASPGFRPLRGTFITPRTARSGRAESEAGIRAALPGIHLSACANSTPQRRTVETMPPMTCEVPPPSHPVAAATDLFPRGEVEIGHRPPLPFGEKVVA